MSPQGYDVINYIDDVIGFGTVSTANTSFCALQALLQKLGFDISIKKLVRPATKVACLGVEVNTEEFTVAVPEEKLSNILEMCQNWSKKSHCTKKQLQSLLGCLLYITKCVRHSRPFFKQNAGLIKKSFWQGTNTTRGLNWFQNFLPQFNGKAFFVHRPVQATIELDACLQGFGAVYMNQVYAVPIPEYCFQFSIVHLEMLNILVAIRVWCQYWANKHIIIKCDNQAVD